MKKSLTLLVLFSLAVALVSAGCVDPAAKRNNAKAAIDKIDVTP